VGLYATEVVPSPFIAVGVVTADPASKTLAVRLSDLESGYGRLLYREAFQAFKTDEEAGRPGPTVYASYGGDLRVSFAVPGDYGMLLFRLGDAAYQELVGKPGLTASIAADRSTRRFIGVSFKHKP
jgi:hypothetical protein